MPYTVTPTAIPEVLILEPKVFGDDRGFFFESFNQRDFQQITGLDVHFVQDNHSKSSKGVLRGLHYQIQHPQGKMVRVAHGAVFDVAVDLRRSSPNFGKWVGVELSAENKRQLWVPPGFAHGFVVTSDSAEFCTKRPITGTPSMSAACYGVMQQWAFSGPWTASLSWPPKMLQPRRFKAQKYLLERWDSSA